MEHDADFAYADEGPQEEPMFVLRAKDPASAEALEAWIKEFVMVRLVQNGRLSAADNKLLESAAETYRKMAFFKARR